MLQQSILSLFDAELIDRINIDQKYCETVMF